MQLDIILRTHSVGNVHSYGDRYVPASKQEIMLRCVQSLVTSINAAQVDIRLYIVDDGSSPEALELLRRICATCRYPVDIRSVVGHGHNDSWLAQVSLGKEVARDVVYFVEDDYLHAPNAIQEMLDAYSLFKRKLGGREIALFPYDDPNNYDGGEYQDEPCRLVWGTARHWRTTTHTTGTCWVSRTTLLNYWSEFERLACGYLKDPTIGEQNTINRIWREGAVLFSPIPSLALHLQYEQHKDPYIDWQKWWNAAAY